MLDVFFLCLTVALVVGLVALVGVLDSRLPDPSPHPTPPTDAPGGPTPADAATPTSERAGA